MRKIGKIAAAGVCLIVLISGAVVVEQHLKRESEIKTKLEEAIGRDAGYTETILKMESDSSHITYGEFFTLCDKSVEERTSLIVGLRGLYPSVNNQTKEKLIDFLNSENDVIRSKRDLYRRKMLLSSAIESATTTAQNSPYSEYGWDYYRRSVTRAKQEALDAAKELQTSATGFVEAYQKTLKLEAGVAESASRSGIRFKPIFKPYDLSNSSEGKQGEDYASQAIKWLT
jgi:hypothetical protein